MTAPAKTRAEREAARHVERVERAIVAARAVAATPEAAELQRRTGGKHGAWTAEDERRLREGVVMTPAGALDLGFDADGNPKLINLLRTQGRV